MTNFTRKGSKLTNEEYDRKLISLKLKRVDEYVNTNTSIKHSCLICNKSYKLKPKQISSFICTCKKREAEYKERIKNKNIDLLESYTNAHDKLNHKCLGCGLVFTSKPKTVSTSKYGCPNCSGKRFTHNKYLSLLPRDIEALETYKTSADYLSHRCKKCGFEWSTKPNYILHMKCGCPNCASSKGEDKIRECLDKLEIKYTKEKTIKIKDRNLRFDFYLDGFSIFIEFDGIQHFIERDYFGGSDYFKRIKENDSLKDEWIKINKLKIIRINYKELNKITLDYMRNLIYN